MKKNRWFTGIIILILLFSMAGTAGAATGGDSDMYAYSSHTKQHTVQGWYNGIQTGGGNVLAWLGIPYAQAPVDELRWRAPQPLAASPEQSHDATQLPPVCMQLSSGQVTGSEDCLYLNIYRPHQSTDNLPVLVFLHGGGNVTGSGASLEAQSLATSTNSVVVTINYRLGLLGWMNNPAIHTGRAAEDSGNFALLDQIQALQWVQQNIHSFGGDAHNVTLAGQSAGARDVLALTISPLAKGLFAKVMPLSGGMTTSTPAEGEAYSNRKLANVLVSAGKVSTEEEGIQYLQQTDALELQKTLRSLDGKLLVKAVGSVMIRMSEFPHLFADGHVLPTEGFDIIGKGNYNRVPMLIGSMENEFNGFAAYDPVFMSSFTKNTWDKATEKQFWQATAYGSKLYSSFNADQVADKYSQDKNASNIYAYRFAWGNSVNDLKAPAKYVAATHGVDLDFLSGNFAGSSFAAMFPKQFYKSDNAAGRIQLMHHYRAYIKSFLYNGTTGSGEQLKWPTWQQSGQLIRFDATNTKVQLRLIKGTPDYNALQKQVRSSLTAEASAIVWDKVLKGRFFIQPQY
ncbi:carboxylesterase family protein [Paenibacillus dauci]|uniref:carboxylesterase family protein n=1 Tax=Paenibacillus dauci TaxID=1567106 RepID=UPI000619BEB8|nr:carboxylesterase family protein [Paenibacillus dauci]